MRKLKKKEVIMGLRAALEKYADPNNWDGDRFIYKHSVSYNNGLCGYYLRNGDLAKRALNEFNEGFAVNCDFPMQSLRDKIDRDM